MSGFAFGFFLFEGIHQLNCGEDADLSAVMLDGLDAKGCGGIGFAGAWAADQHDILGAIQKLAFVQLAHCCFIDLAGGEVEAGEVLIGVECRRVQDRTLSS